MSSMSSSRRYLLSMEARATGRNRLSAPTAKWRAHFSFCVGQLIAAELVGFADDFEVGVGEHEREVFSVVRAAPLPVEDDVQVVAAEALEGGLDEPGGGIEEDGGLVFCGGDELVVEGDVEALRVQGQQLDSVCAEIGFEEVCGDGDVVAGGVQLMGVGIFIPGVGSEARGQVGGDALEQLGECCQLGVQDLQAGEYGSPEVFYAECSGVNFFAVGDN